MLKTVEFRNLLFKRKEDNANANERDDANTLKTAAGLFIAIRMCLF